MIEMYNLKINVFLNQLDFIQNCFLKGYILIEIMLSLFKNFLFLVYFFGVVESFYGLNFRKYKRVCREKSFLVVFSFLYFLYTDVLISLVFGLFLKMFCVCISKLVCIVCLFVFVFYFFLMLVVVLYEYCFVYVLKAFLFCESFRYIIRK